MENPIAMTAQEVCQRYNISKYTLLNWRNGYYRFGAGEKVYYFTDRSRLETQWNNNYRRLEYNPIKVAVWANKLEKKKRQR